MSEILDKIAALLAHADGTDNEQEREAFVSKAQSLATTYAVDLELARVRQRNKTVSEVPEVRQIRIGNRGQKLLHRFAELFIRIGGANDLEFTVAHNSTYVNAFGYPSDVDVTERLYASLAVQMQRACNEAIKAGEHKKEENLYFSDATWTRRADARVFRNGFYEAFTREVCLRLHEAKKEAESQSFDLVTTDEETGVERTEQVTGALVLVGKRETVRDFYRATSNPRGTWKGGAGSSGSGHSAGRAAGQRANLHGTQHALPGSRKGISG